MGLVKLSENNSQAALSAVASYLAVQRIDQYKFFAVVPPGKGKSRIISGLVLGACNKTKTIADIHVVFPNQALHDQDYETYQTLNRVLSKAYSAQLHLTVGLRNVKKLNNKSLLIIDEGDY